MSQTNDNGENADPPRKWNSAQIQLQHWLALPEQDRQPQTQRELAPLLDRQEDALGRWKRLPGFMDEVHALVRVEVDGYLATALGVIGRRAAKEGNLEDVRFLLKLAGRWTEERQPANFNQFNQLNQFNVTTEEAILAFKRAQGQLPAETVTKEE
jgi:hypothetical protein